ncbi:MAG: hypothetical protein FRC53_09220 [Pseudoramibacter sp. EUB1.1]|uniref:Uncharacterized protein n=1 Tax=Candidatus Pseudoramibacter fermentans TaxID=2594427 RepID=A0A6L5GTJ6_9FIRM|nr:hypothetical protein [Candidatus Pseudoramibacter fermentans]
MQEIQRDREAHHKKPLKDKDNQQDDDDDDHQPLSGKTRETKSAQPIRKADGFTKGNTNSFRLHRANRLRSNGWILAYDVFPEICMTVGPLKAFMTR